jgi:hypothetical protein
VDVLHKMVEALEPGGLVFDLQVIRPNPVVEVEGLPLCEIDGASLFRTADAAVSAIDAVVTLGQLVEQAVDDHDVLKHYGSGADLVDAFIGKQRKLPEQAVPRLRALERSCTVRERCRLRRLQVRPIAGLAVRTDL